MTDSTLKPPDRWSEVAQKTESVVELRTELSESKPTAAPDVDRQVVGRAQLLIYASGVLLLAGLFAPCVTVTPHLRTPMGDVMVLWRWFSDSAAPRSFSIVSGLLHMAQDGDVVIAILIAAFSIVFPAWKLVVMHRACRADLRTPRGVARLEADIDRIGQLGRWSMLDVFVLGLAVISFKSNPGGTTMHLEAGAYLFCASVLTGMFAVGQLKAALSAATLRGRRGE